jgi:UDP-sugar transporter A1/2/3
MGGILTALVHKYAGATRKGFALILGLVMTGVMQSVIERERPSMDEMLAMALVILSSYLHLAFPPMA